MRFFDKTMRWWCRFRESGKSYLKLLVGMVLLMFVVLLTSCGSAKPRVITTKKQQERYERKNAQTITDRHRKIEEIKDEYDVSLLESSTVNKIIVDAKTYLGTSYKYGGNTKRGIDCSGLIHNAFMAAGITVPRTSGLLYEHSQVIKLKHAAPGDLLFFATGKSSKKVTHVGLVTRVTPAEVIFIHASSSRGVIESSLNEFYWVNAFLSAGRVL